MTHNDATQGTVPGEKAQRFYRRLCEHAGGGTTLSTRNADLAKALGIAYPLVVRWMQELEACDWISRKQNKQQATTVHLLRASGAQLMSVAPTGELPVAPDVTTTGGSNGAVNAAAEMNFVNRQSSQSSQSSRLGAAQSSQSSQSSREKRSVSVHVRTTEVNQASSKQAAADLNFVNFVNPLERPASSVESAENAEGAARFEMLADFRRRVLAVIFEFGIAGRKRQQLCDAIVALAAKHFTAERAEEILADLRRAQESVSARQRVGLVRSLPAVGMCILEEYAETGQMVLFELPPEAPPVTPPTQAEVERKRQAEREKMRQAEAAGRKFRRPQATYTDEARQQKNEEARKRNEAREAAKKQQSEATR